MRQSRGIEGAGTVVLRPVELNPARDPRPGQPDQGRLDHLVVVDEMVAVGFIQRHLHPPADFGQDHDLEIAILQKDGVVRPVLLSRQKSGR